MSLKTATLVSSESMDLGVERNKNLDMGATMLIPGIGMGLPGTQETTPLVSGMGVDLGIGISMDTDMSSAISSISITQDTPSASGMESVVILLRLPCCSLVCTFLR